MKKIYGFIIVAVMGVAILVAGGAVYAQQNKSNIGQGNGMKIAPVRNDKTIDKGGTQTFGLFVENITASPVVLKAVTNDFLPSDDESGEPKIILNPNESAPGNSFKSIVRAVPGVSLQPNERKEVVVTVSVPNDASSGGYYGAVRFVPDHGEGNENVSLTASAGSIFLIRVPGNITEKLSVESFGVASDAKSNPATLFNSGPVTIVTRFRNLGNIHVQPFGKISVKNMTGKVVQEIEINNTQPRGSVLPTSIRKFTNEIDQKKLFGKYTLEASFGYGSNGELITARKTFYVIPYKLIGLIAVLILFLVFGLPRIVRSYNQKVINKSRRAGK